MQSVQAALLESATLQSGRLRRFELVLKIIPDFPRIIIFTKYSSDIIRLSNYRYIISRVTYIYVIKSATATFPESLVVSASATLRLGSAYASLA